MSTQAYIMFAGEQDGEIVLSYVHQRAWEVRSKIAELYAGDWKHARRDGWRVVQVVVQDRKAWQQRARA